MSFGGPQRCERCGLAVYHAEQAMGPGRKIYHKLCLKCEQCGKRLDSGSLVQHDNLPYCARCHTQLFGTRDLRHANVLPSPSSSPARPPRPSAEPLSVLPDLRRPGGAPSPRPVPPPKEYYTPPDLSASSLNNDTFRAPGRLSASLTASGSLSTENDSGSLAAPSDIDPEITRPNFRSERPIAVPFAGGARALDERGLLRRGDSPRSKVGERPDFEDRCNGCDKRVYAAEQVFAIGKKWHRGCLRCVNCKSTIDPSKVSDRDGAPWCKNCYARAHGPEGIAGKR